MPEIVEFKGARSLYFTNLADVNNIAKMITKTAFVPKAYINKPEEATIAMIFGMEVGLPPIASLQNIAVVNGQPSIWGDAQLALVRSSGLLKEYKQEYIGTEGTDNFKCIVTVSRSDTGDSIKSEFSVADAKKAGLWGKIGTWSTHPKRMLMYKARAFALRDLFSDILKGLHSVEEMEGETIIEDKQIEDKQVKENNNNNKGTIKNMLNITPTTEEQPQEPEQQLEEFLI